MAQLWQFNMQLLFKILLFSVFSNFCNAASLIQLPPANRISLPSNSTNISTIGSPRFIDVIKFEYEQITTQYSHTFLIGIQVQLSNAQYSSIRMIFTNIARTRDNGLIVSLGPNGQWSNPLIVNRDYGAGNKILFRPALTLDILDAQKILRSKYPRAQYTAVYLYQPKMLGGRMDQPYWIFGMVDSILWDKYLWVGVVNFQVSGTNEIPESVTRGIPGYPTVA